MRNYQEPFTQQDLTQILNEKARTGFYGTLEFHFQFGKVIVVKTTQTFKKEGSNQYNDSPTNR